MSIADKALLLKKDFDDVYEAGRKSFMEDYQQGGKRTNYYIAFAGVGWNDETYQPIYDLICVGNVGTMFGNARITNTKVAIDWTLATATNYAFSSASYVVTIPMLILGKNTPYVSHTFGGLTNLENLTIGGVIGQNGFDMSACKKLTVESLLSILHALENKSTDTSGTSWVCTLGTENLAKLTDAEKAIATQKGWTLA